MISYSVYLYIIAIVLVFLSLFQKSSKMMIKYWKFHKPLGFFITITSMIISIWLILITLQEHLFLIAEAGMRISSIIWIYFAFYSLSTGLKKQRINHKTWVNRTFSMNIAFVLSLPLFLILNMFAISEEIALTISFWFNWIPILVFMELIFFKKHTK